VVPLGAKVRKLIINLAFSILIQYNKLGANFKEEKQLKHDLQPWDMKSTEVYWLVDVLDKSYCNKHYGSA